MNGKDTLAFPASFFGAEELGALIKKARKLREMTQTELSMQTNISKKFISNIENGKETAHIGKVLLLLRVLELGTQLIDLRDRRADG